MPKKQNKLTLILKRRPEGKQRERERERERETITKINETRVYTISTFEKSVRHGFKFGLRSGPKKMLASKKGFPCCYD